MLCGTWVRTNEPLAAGRLERLTEHRVAESPEEDP
jgi:hypothetical protein